MRIALALSLLLIAATTAPARAGFEFNENFTVLTPAIAESEDGKFARDVLAQAEKLRREIALEWLGEELPAGVGKTTINVAFSDRKDSGLTWAKDDPRRRYHILYLTTTPQRALGATLSHEMVHVVLATRYPDRLPAWIEEGIASRYDDDQRIAERNRVVDWFQKTGAWPNLQQVLSAENIRAVDVEHYAVAASLAEFLISKGGADGKSKLLAFGQDAAAGNTQHALLKHYGIRNIDDLQAQWRAWLKSGDRLAVNSPKSAAGR